MYTPQTIIEDLTNDSSINDFVNGNISPSINKNRTLPALIYNLSDGMRQTYFVGSYGHSEQGLDLMFYSTSYEVNKNFESAAIDKFNGTTSSNFGFSRVDNISTSTDSVDDDVYMSIVSITIIN